MATERLTNAQRLRITRLAVDDVIDKETLELGFVENDLLAEVLERSAKMQGLEKEYKIVRSLPTMWVRDSSSIYVSVGPISVELAARKPRPDERRLIIPSPLALRECLKLDHKEPLARRLIALDSAHKELKSRKTMLEAKVTGLLAQASTHNKLRELWPEGEPYWGPVLSSVKPRSLPTVKTDEVNRLLKLPKEEQTHAAPSP